MSSESALAGWIDGAAREALIGFIDESQDVSPERRVAVFDNDGTLWCEKPMYPQADFFIAELRAMAAERPAIADRPEYAALLAGVREAFAEFGLARIAMALVELFEGMPPEEYERRVRSFFATAVHASGRPYTAMLYKPMLALLAELRTAGFSVFIVSGGGVEFVRAVARQLYGVSPEGVVGSAVSYEFAEDGGVPALRRTAKLLGGPNEGRDKIANIQSHLGRRPIFAAGNSAGDREMLDYALASGSPSLALLVNHDDDVREYAYESEAASFASSESIIDVAQRSGWVVASMKRDWSVVF